MNVLEKVKEVLYDVLRLEDIKDDTQLFDISGVTQLDAIEVIMTLEHDLDISISDEEAENIKTVKDLVDLVTKKVTERGKVSGEE